MLSLRIIPGYSLDSTYSLYSHSVSTWKGCVCHLWIQLLGAHQRMQPLTQGQKVSRYFKTSCPSVPWDKTSEACAPENTADRTPWRPGLEKVNGSPRHSSHLFSIRSCSCGCPCVSGQGLPFCPDFQHLLHSIPFHGFFLPHGNSRLIVM